MFTTLRSVLENALWLLPGGLVGGLTMLMLWWTVRCMRPDTDSGNTARVRAWRGYIFRLAAVAGVLVWAACQGTGPLLWAFVGLMACRWAAIPRLSQHNA
jgi:hypothetical protein